MNRALFHMLIFLFVGNGLFTGMLYGQCTSNEVQLRIIRVGWSSKAWDTATNDTTIVKVKEGMHFGAKNSPSYFTLLEIIDASTINIRFSDELVVVGEPINYPSKHNPIIIFGNGKCFRLRLYDAGSDFCIEIIRTKEKTDLQSYN